MNTLVLLNESIIICKNAKNKATCTSSLSLLSGKVVKINGNKIDKQLDEYHKQSFCKQTDEEILQLASNMVTQVKNEQLSV